MPRDSASPHFFSALIVLGPTVTDLMLDAEQENPEH
jgi:hypothetical protein